MLVWEIFLKKCFLFFFHDFQEHVATSWFDNNSFKKFFRAIIIQIYGKPEDDRKTLDLRSSQEFNYTTARLVFQEVIREELEVILGNLSDYRQWKIDQETKEEITTDGLQQSEEQNVALIAEFIRVEKQVEALESLTLSLKEDLEVIKMKNDEWVFCVAPYCVFQLTFEGVNKGGF